MRGALFFFLMAALMALQAVGKTVALPPGNITDELIKLSQQVPLHGTAKGAPRSTRVNTTDTLVILLDTGHYTLEHGVLMRCNVVVRGKGPAKTTLTCARGFDTRYRDSARPVHTWEWDDGFLSIQGQKGREVSVEITDLTMEMAPGTTCHEQLNLVKIGHAHSVVMRNVTSSYHNFIAHNLDMRVCSNVVVEHCTFTAYNNLPEGAVMALRGNTEHVVIRNNTFHKHGNDEVITFFGLLDDLSSSITGTYRAADGTSRPITSTIVPEKNFKRDILIEGNTFHYDKVDAPIDHAVNSIDVLISLYDFDMNIVPVDALTEGHNCDNVTCHISDFVVRGNRFVATAPVATWLSVTLSKHATRRGIVIEDNTFEQEACSLEQLDEPLGYRRFFNIDDNSPEQEPIVIRNNVLRNRDVSWVTYDGGRSYETRYNILETHGGSILFEGNRVTDAARHPLYKGVTLLAMQQSDDGGDALPENSIARYMGRHDGRATAVTLSHNVVEGLQRLAWLVDTERTPTRLVLTGNRLEGGTHMETHSAGRLDVMMSGNELFSTSQVLLLNGSPQEGQLTLTGNTFHNQGAQAGQRLIENYEWRTGTHPPMRLSRLELTGNTFHGYDRGLLDDAARRLATGCTQKVDGNTFSR